MSFRTNPSQQISWNDNLRILTDRERKVLDRSWAKAFAEDVFPNIDEDRFSVLYSTRASRPNTPVNVIVGALILKELFGLSDDEMVETLMMDIRFQYALHTTSFEEQPLSDKTLSRFRRRCYAYETLYDVDLFGDAVRDLSASLARIMRIDGRIRRMDSTMIEANIRRLSRMELLYTCIAKLVRYLSKNVTDIDLTGLEHYLDPDDYNRVIYHNRTEDTDQRMLTLLQDADRLIELCDGRFDDATEYQLFVRCMSEQTVVENSTRRLKTKEDNDMDSGIMQNPSDPDATYRKKAGKEHRGYTANLEESVGENGSIVTNFDVEPNNTSDSAMLKKHLENTEPEEETVTVIADGAYSGTENTELASKKNMELVPTALSGKDPDPIMAEFRMNDDGTKVLECPAGHEPKSCSYSASNDTCYVSFLRDQCVNCPFKDQCRPKIYKRVAKKTVSRKTVDRAEALKEMKTERYQLLTRLRNGIETIPSLLKNRYGANSMPVRGLKRVRLFIGAKIAAINFRKLFRFRTNTGHYARNAILV